jgi:peptidoglycan/xylan/chitin deacetylase (PgdA/CDA1 family)
VPVCVRLSSAGMSASQLSWSGRARARALPPGLRVVLYHHLTARSTELEEKLEIATPPELFEAHMVRLLQDYEVVDLDCVLSGPLPRRALLVTFDDGYRSILELALPVLRRLGVPSVFFVAGAFLDQDSLPLDNLLCWLEPRVGLQALERAISGGAPRCRSLGELIDSVAEFEFGRRMRLSGELVERYCVDQGRIRAASGLFLERDDLARLADFGCEVANHTRSHMFCRTIATEAQGAVELVDHRAQLQEWTGRPVRAFSYPYGSRVDATPLVQQILTESGHEASFLVESRPNYAPHPNRPWNRVSLHAYPVSQLTTQLEVLPPLRAIRDAVSSST